MKLLFIVVAGLFALLASVLAIAACVRAGQVSRELADPDIEGE